MGDFSGTDVRTGYGLFYTRGTREFTLIIWLHAIAGFAPGNRAGRSEAVKVTSEDLKLSM